MFYPADFEHKIGFERIRELVKNRCLFQPGKELIDSLEMLRSKDILAEELDRVEEFRRIQLGDDEFPIHNFCDNREALKKARVEGTFMEVEEIASLGKSLESVRLILRFFSSKEEDEFPRMRELCKVIHLFPFVGERIQKILNKHGHIRDNASPELANIRSTLSSRQSSVSRLLNKLMKKAQAEGWVEEDSAATIRNGRPVIPVPASHKRRLGGLIHDESATGKTVFVEPAEVVELNNEIKELEYAERREIIKILIKFTDDIRPYISDLEGLHDFLAQIDSIRARALFALDMHAVRPRILDSPGFEWEQAIHPLLYLTFKDQGRTVVPLNLELSNDDRLLLISGPNAGGKSVCLKTVGLLQYMLQCGMLVPVKENSGFGVFDDIFIDIGDEQSIDNDLSTYSSHLMNMKHFLKNASKGTLILIDEFGTGTEPMLGGAIAESILEKLNESKTFGVITTHYTNLKHFAASTHGIANGAMLFDNQKMQPLYELQVGKPGSSFAFEIARKIGLPESVLQTASERIGQDHIDFDKHLRDVLRDKKYWERKRQKIRQSEKKLEELMLRYQEELDQTEKKRKALIGEAKQQAEELLSKTNKQIENTIREIKEANAEKERTRQVRKELEAYKEEVHTADVKQEDHLAKEYRKMKRREGDLSHRRPDLRKKVVKNNLEKKAEEKSQEIRVGDIVRLKGQETSGEVLEIKANNCIVAFGHLKSTVKLPKLEKLDSKEAKSVSPEAKSKVDLGDWNVSRRRANFRGELDVRGKRADEALKAVSDLIDEAVMVNASDVRILHGKGDGILRQLIRDFLYTSDVVDSFSDEHIERGGSGITVVRLSY